MTAPRFRAGPAHGWFFRLVAVVLAAGFLGTGAVDAYGLHRCPHHDGLPGAGAPASAAAGHEAHGAAAQSEAPSEAQSEAQSPDEHGDAHGEHGPCTCVGACGPSGSALHKPTQVAAHAHQVRRTARVRTPGEHAPVHPAYLLPFANAPPSMS